MHFVRETTSPWSGFVDLELQRRRIIENQFNIGVEKIDHPEVDRLLDRLLVSLEKIYGLIQVLQLERLGGLDANVPHLQPLLTTIERGVRSQRAVGHHGKQCPLDVEPACATGATGEIFAPTGANSVGHADAVSRRIDREMAGGRSTLFRAGGLRRGGVSLRAAARIRACAAGSGIG